MELVPEAEQPPVPALSNPIRNKRDQHTAHMLTVQWTADLGWARPAIQAYRPLSIHPNASALHYAIQSFEGMKVYRGYDGKLRLFRPLLNCERLQLSNACVGLPTFGPQELLQLIIAFVSVECPRWLPEPHSHLYIRPAMIGMGSSLGVQIPPEALFFMTAALFPQRQVTQNPMSSIKLLASPMTMVRAWPGGIGYAKVGANYGPTMRVQDEAKQQGCTSTLWLFGEDEQVTECGGSNFFVIWIESNSVKLVTPPLEHGLILDGITRKSVLELARERLSSPNAECGKLKPLVIEQRTFTMTDIRRASEEGRLLEGFVTGTSVSIMPVSAIVYKGDSIPFPSSAAGRETRPPITQTLGYANIFKRWLDEICYGTVIHEWACEVSNAEGCD
ncbi:branched-chain amino acid aminotransferase II [Aspergillus pseudonomiae]|uniref:Branched-chain-amino-acid aminotransferase n=1 Tax=Aspergillus pseudonomiae TaxID=1506151 RepID=A0A5N6HYB6_9EURO|nr:branched-chain amino acid aminotransferase II [Aspergillus pseudonomiae]KAB8259461.1 branched-chain amino acid aminotransferase II [Aspergillus pseudonomiae]KAE8404377.1 branched-chain amino acid aminotransferase II [Aspergillus pseudonomiae]